MKTDYPPVSVFLLRYNTSKDMFESTTLNISGDGHFRLPVNAETGETVKAAVLLQHLGTSQSLLYDKDKDVWRDVTEILFTEILGDDAEGKPSGETRGEKFSSYLLSIPEGNYFSMDLTNGFKALDELAANAEESSPEDVSVYDLSLDEEE